ncbi:TMEM165/GDT1 family protein [Leptolyngbya sp. FACHB-711]|uniref:TMEM165/GDT1 family protein n=1 Tax=unclassified Leptolyngbya TaxID=2650499 RepID=UPI0016862A78|nr:TMEM165/GDT1 family protein [Leptolyngbya sp. FACHB-711]MBD1849681.1 TMEM165/GDT1 family protein [Cyanobacteria bacterium FACHB-502]MBD2024228.1 TMEM165/GDT1 family protein [Leptolyngbya sp. FACHB-711]
MLTGFTAALLLITVSELGDKTFFVSAILAMRHPRRWVFLGAVLALAAMTVLSVLLGQFATLLPEIYVRWGEILLFLCFGLKLLYDARQMSPNGCLAEEQEAAETVMEAESKIKPRRSLGVVSQAFGLTFLGEWGDRTQITTIALAAANHPIGVSLGAILGHALCALIAVQCGKFFCGRVSEQKLTAIGGGLFLLFASMSFTRLMGWVG